MEAREERRRKILARGSDRLAFITGEKPVLSSASQLTTAPCVTSVDTTSPTAARSGDAALIRLSDTRPTSEVAIEDVRISDPASLEPAAFTKVDAESSVRILRDVHQQPQAVTAEENLGIPGRESIASVEHETSEKKDDARRSTNSEAQRFDPKANGFVSISAASETPLIPPLTCEGIARCIDATENYRVSGAFFLALILIAQSCSYHVGQRNSPMHKWVLPWPVVLVIVIDVSLIFGAHMLGSAFREVQKDDINITQKGEVSQASDKVGKLEHVLEVGTVLLKTSQALVLDCSIYVVVLTTGYSLVQIWQPA